MKVKVKPTKKEVSSRNKVSNQKKRKTNTKKEIEKISNKKKVNSKKIEEIKKKQKRTTQKKIKKRSKRKKRRNKFFELNSKKKIKEALLFIVILFATTVLFIGVGSFFFSMDHMKGHSMIPTINNSDVLITKKTTNIRRFDLVLYSRGNVTEVRRVVGRPGESIEYIDDTLYIDGKIVNERFINQEINNAQVSGGQYTEDFNLHELLGSSVIPENHYLLMADNRDYGYDSREFGLISTDQIIGIVKWRIFPITEFKNF